MNAITKKIISFLPSKKTFAHINNVAYVGSFMEIKGLRVMEVLRQGNAKHTAGGYTIAGYFIEEGQVFKSIKQLVEYYN